MGEETVTVRLTQRHGSRPALRDAGLALAAWSGGMAVSLRRRGSILCAGTDAWPVQACPGLSRPLPADTRAQPGKPCGNAREPGLHGAQSRPVHDRGKRPAMVARHRTTSAKEQHR